MKICQNIDLVQINVKSNVDQSDSFGLSYYLPKNVSWANEKIDKIVVACPLSNYRRGMSRKYLQSPIDGQPIYTSRDFAQKVPYHLEDDGDQGIYFDIFKKDGEVLAKDLSFLSLLSSNNNVIEINSQLDLNQTVIHVPGKLYFDGAILLYIFWGGHDEPSFEYPTENISVNVPLLASQKMSFTEIINNYVHIQPNKIKGIYVYDVRTKSQAFVPDCDSAVFVTLRDFNQTYIINNVLDCMFKEQRQNLYAEDVVAIGRNHPYFDADIDFDNSFIQNGYEELDTTVTIIFEY